ncbi:MAG: hypothetical protein JWO90_892 [Solirubrobacterales bacterium]|jgi:hypothetical protein|nr:hypothetical protein [Solirubrobacterales bacterium]
MSVTALLVLAAEEAESSKTVFYIAGGALAIWAVIVSLIGLSRPEFPRTEGVTRGVYGISAVLVVFAMASSILSG